jgi:hypothetical protein
MRLHHISGEMVLPTEISCIYNAQKIDWTPRCWLSWRTICEWINRGFLMRGWHHLWWAGLWLVMVNGKDYPIYYGKRNVPNHQPETNVEKGILVPSRPGEYLFRLMKSSSFLVPDRNNAPLTVRKRHLLAGSCPILIGQLPSWG